MKRTFALFLCLFTACAAFAGDEVRYIANLTGSAFEDINVEAGRRNFRTKLNNDRVYKEFGVEKEDYALVLRLQSSWLVSLVPRSASSGLETIPVVIIDSSRMATNVNNGMIAFETPVSNLGAGTTIFNQLRGTMMATANYTGQGLLPRFIGQVNASGVRGVLAKGSSGSGVVLQFTITRGAVFNQQP